MNKNLNLVEILKDCPKGTKFYTTVWGEVSFEKIVDGEVYTIEINTGSGYNHYYLTKEGCYIKSDDAECVIFPSKDQRDWSKFTAPWYNIEKQCKQALPQTNECAWLYLVSDVLTLKDGIGQYLYDQSVQELAKRLCREYAQKLYNPSNTGKNKQKSSGKIEPKFKAGNWYQCTKDFFGKGVTFDKNTVYYCTQEGCLQDEYGCHIAIVKDLYDNFKLWTIQDAKDGDILAFDNDTIVIFKNLYNSKSFHSYCHIENCTFNVSEDELPDCWSSEGFKPATKEQRDAFMKAMNYAGYKWDEEKKELKKLVHNRFDHKTLQPFDKVLVRDDCESEWQCNLLSHVSYDSNYELKMFPYKCMGCTYRYCIPYNDDTKHLVGTSNEAPEYYRYWDD